MVASKDINEHLETLEDIFKRLTQKRLKLRMDKCEFLKSKIKYFGFLISENGIWAGDKGIEAVKNCPAPSKEQAVESFLGLSSHFRRFIKDFSSIAKPLYDLLRKVKPFQFGEEEMNCFISLKELLNHQY